ncbi:MULTISPECIES: hypothetical protein [Vibrio]|uniref:hypothetical protein n=1 Tax=Vibrio TaxID=662 RepID=UPI00142F1A93|nr:MULTISPECIES: hypothetical protein [Vibrio]
MEKVITSLKKEFKARIQSPKRNEAYATPSSLSFLTQEELSELENAWVQLAVWKKTQIS